MRTEVFEWRSVRLVAAALGMALLATACVSAGDSGGSDTSQAGGDVKPLVAKEPSEPTTITFSVFSSVGGSPQFKKFAEDFHKKYPNITVDFQLVPAERATDKLVTQVAGGNVPDAAYMDSSAVEDFSSRNSLVNLDSYIAGSDVIEQDDYVDGFRQAVEFDGSMFGLPFDGETTGLFYRTDLFEQAGIDGAPKTWEEFESAAQKLTDTGDKKYGFILFAPEAYYYWYPWLWQAGGDLLSEDQSSVAFDDAAGQRAAEFYVGLRKYSPPDYLSSNSYDGRVAFATGKVGMYMAGSWFGGTLKTEFPEINDKWAAAPLPEGPAGCATTLAGDTLAVFDQSQNQDAAWLWIEFLSEEKNLKAWTYGSKTTTLLPTRQSLLDDPELGKYNPWLQGFADNMKCAVTSNITQPKWVQIEQGLNEKLGEALYGDIDPVDAVKEAAQQGEDLLAQ